MPPAARTAALLAAASLLAVATGCSRPAAPTASPDVYGIHIDVHTPQGLRAKQTMDMLNSDWPIGTMTVGTLAAHDRVDDTTVAMDRLWWDRPIKATGIDVGAGQATLHVVNSYGAVQDIELRTDDTGMVDRFGVTLRPPRIDRWADVDAELTRSGARYSYLVSRVTGTGCATVAGTNPDAAMPLASIFKLYVLLALADAVHAGSIAWTTPLTITKEVKAVGSAGFDALPPGSTVPVRQVAQQMISASDNMATDMLINALGPGAVVRALVHAGHHDPASMTPFPTTHELFAVGWGDPDVRSQWQNATRPQRAEMLAQTNVRPYHPDPNRTHTPASPFGAEWYGSAADICRVHAALQAAAVGPAAPVRDILSATPGIDLDSGRWAYIGAKGGNLPGDLTFSWYAADHAGQGYVVSFQLSWPKYRSLTAASWLLSIARQAFGLIPAAPTPR